MKKPCWAVLIGRDGSARLMTVDGAPSIVRAEMALNWPPLDLSGEGDVPTSAEREVRIYSLSGAPLVRNGMAHVFIYEEQP